MHVNYYEYPPAKIKSQAAIKESMRRLQLPPKEGGKYGLFFSVPFCRTKCASCPYFKALLPPEGRRADSKLEQYFNRVIKELNQRARSPYFQGRTAAAVYVGGGTASLLSARHLGYLMETLDRLGILSEETEITLEGNPWEFSLVEYVAPLKALGINRLSVGFQSASEETLGINSIRAPHNAEQSTRSLHVLSSTGLPFNVDLMYGTPSQTIESWLRDVEYVRAIRPHSITINRYVWYNDSLDDPIKPLSRYVLDDNQADLLYGIAKRQLESDGYCEFRYGSFSMPGFEQLYSQKVYGEGTDLLGVGVGAYSWIENRTTRNTRSVEAYLRARDGQQLVAGVSRALSPDEVLIRNCLQSLHSGRSSGDKLSNVEYEFGSPLIVEFFDRIRESVNSGVLQMLPDSGQFRLTSKGLRSRQEVLWRLTPIALKSLLGDE